MKKEIQKQIDDSLLERLKGKFLGSKAEIFETLDELLQASFNNDFTDVTALQTISARDAKGAKEEARRTIDSEVSLNVKALQPPFKVGANAAESYRQTNENS